MKKMLLWLGAVFACGAGVAGKTEAENVQRYYDDTAITCSLRLPKPGIDSGTRTLNWQLVMPHGRVMAQGRVTGAAGRVDINVPLKFDKLQPGISLKCSLQMRIPGGKVIAEQPIVVYSKQIFADIAGKLKKLGAGAVLPEDEIKNLNELGLALPETSLDNFDNPANKVIFCAVKDYCDNLEMLRELMKRGVTLVMFAPDDDSEVYLPSNNFSKIIIISVKDNMTKNGLGVICNKEKIVAVCRTGNGGLVQIEYPKGKIIIIANSVYRSLGKIPDFALIIKKCLTQ